MNPLNYASLEASKRLQEAGIVLETEKYWYQDAHGWYLGLMPTVKGQHTPVHIPALSMAEAWREFGDDVYITRHWDRERRIYKTRATLTMLMSPAYTDTNPTDALIDLLIWVRKNQ